MKLQQIVNRPDRLKNNFNEQGKNPRPLNGEKKFKNNINV